MQRWNALPTEVLSIIVRYVDKNDDLEERLNELSQFALTCRSWRETAQPVLFSKITLKNFGTASENLLCLMVNNSRLGTYVKELYNRKKVKLTSLIAMDSLFPNLDKIWLESCEGVSYYSFCKLITEEKRFRNLKSIPIPENLKHVDMYIECLFTLKSQITEVCLLDGGEKCDTYLCLCDNLYQFPSLQSVCIYQYSEDSYRNIMDYVETITVQNNLIHLEKIVLKLAGRRCLRLPFREIHNIQPSTKIKYISIAVYSFQNYEAPNEQCMLYIMKKFPNPSRVRLFMNDGYINIPLMSSEQNENATIILQFLQYLCKIQNCYVSDSIPTDKHTASLLVKDLLTSISLRTKVKIPRIYITGKNYITQEVIPIKTYIGIKSNVVDNTRTIAIAFNKNTAAEFEQQLLNLVQEAGCFFTELNLETETAGQLMSGLNCVGKYCHKLKKLTLMAKEELLYGNLLTLEKISNEAKNYSLKELYISGFDLTSDPLCSITAQFPCLENLIINRVFGQSYSGQDLMIFNDERTVSTRLDNTLLKFLTIKEVLFFKFSGSLSGIHVNVTTDAGSSRYVFLSTEREEFRLIEGWSRYRFVPLIGYDENILNSTKDEHCITWHIHCKSIEKLDIIFPTVVTRHGVKKELLQTHTFFF